MAGQACPVPFGAWALKHWPDWPLEPGTERLAASGLTDRIRNARRWLSQSYAADLATKAGRRRAWWHFQLADHGFLRSLWSNRSEIAPGVYRSNQPDPKRIAKLAEEGIRTIINLRAPIPSSYYLLEREACAAQGIALISHQLSSGMLPPRAAVLALYQSFLAAEKPLMMHCKSGADRTGLAAALYLILICDAPVADAARQLHWRFLHFSGGPRGVLDFMLTSYARAQAETGIPMLEWIKTVYDPVALTAAYPAGTR